MRHPVRLVWALTTALWLDSFSPVPADLLVGSSGGEGMGKDSILRFDETTGAFICPFVSSGSGGLDNPLGMTLGPDGNLYVSSRFTVNVLRYSGTTGEFMDVFSAGHGLWRPHGLAFGPDGNLYLSESGAHRVMRFNGVTGAFMDTFASGGGLSFPTALIFGPDGNLYVSSSFNHRVLRYNGTSGAFIDVFALGGGLSNAQGLDFGPDGNLYVGSFNGDSVLRYSGTTGAFIDAFVPPGSGGLNAPNDVEFGPDGNLYVQSSQSARVVRYNGATGAVIDTFEGGGLSGQGYLLFTDALQVCAAADGESGTLQDDTVLDTRVFEVCDTIEVGPGFQVAGPSGVLRLRAGIAVVFKDGASVGLDGELSVELVCALRTSNSGSVQP